MAGRGKIGKMMLIRRWSSLQQRQDMLRGAVAAQELVSGVEAEQKSQLIGLFQAEGTRPSLILPIASCVNETIGSLTKCLGQDISSSYQSGLQSAMVEYCNDQIREIYATQPEEKELKEVFKQHRDTEFEPPTIEVPVVKTAAKVIATGMIQLCRRL